MIKLTKILWVCALAACFSLSSCVKEPDGTLVPHGDDEVVMSLSTMVPIAATPETRALSNANEQALSQVKVIAFNASNQYLYVRDGVVSNVVNNTNGAGTATIRFSAKVSTANVYFVVVANANTEVGTALTGATSTTTKTTILNALTKVLTAGTAWGSTAGTTIPMHGETAATTVAHTTAAAAINVTLTRMLARINVVSSVAKTTFQLTTVRLYNTNRGGYIAPITPPQSGWAYLHTPPSTNSPLLYTLSSTEQTANALTNAIYTFERTGVTSASPVVLVVGGKYNGSATETFYRMNLMIKGSPDQYLDLQRNYSYNFGITGITGPGYATAAEAYAASAMNINANVQVWNDHEFREVTWNGQYKLGITQEYYQLASNSWIVTNINNQLVIQTDYPSGWTAAVYDDLAGTSATAASSWLSLSSSAGLSNASVAFLMGTNPNTATRTAYVHITAGLLILKATIMQEAPPIYTGMLSGQLADVGGGVWRYEKSVYVQTSYARTSLLWQTENIPATATTNLWDGKQNTYNLYHASTKHPAADNCFTKNDNYTNITGVNDPNYNWFLPAQKQLEALWVILPALPSGTMSSNYHLSSTEEGNTNSMVFHFGSSSSQQYAKSTAHYVRCVSERIP